jgi:dihydrofolate reductase
VVTLSPKIFGTGLGLFSPDVAMDLSLEEVERAGSELVVLRYRVLQARVSENAEAGRRVGVCFD